jgi:predicted RNA methylase
MTDTIRTGMNIDPEFAAELALRSDRDFDKIYDPEVRRLSAQHWTPVRVAARAATLLAQAGAQRVLDVGSGVGKFCIVGALTTNAHFTGVERRANLVEIARAAAARLRASQTTFVNDNVDAFSFEGFDGIYLYNPFHEQISASVIPIDQSFKRSDAAHKHFVRKTTEKLAAVASGTVVVTFNGFGGPMPRAFTFKGEELAGNDWLEWWTKD